MIFDMRATMTETFAAYAHSLRVVAHEHEDLLAPSRHDAKSWLVCSEDLFAWNFIDVNTASLIRNAASAGLRSAKHLAELFTPAVHLLAAR
jgi:hypothetical protein